MSKLRYPKLELLSNTFMIIFKFAEQRNKMINSSIITVMNRNSELVIILLPFLLIQLYPDLAYCFGNRIVDYDIVAVLLENVL